MAANKRAGRRRRLKHRGSMKVITVDLLLSVLLSASLLAEHSKPNNTH